MRDPSDSNTLVRSMLAIALALIVILASGLGSAGCEKKKPMATGPKVGACMQMRDREQKAMAGRVFVAVCPLMSAHGGV